MGVTPGPPFSIAVRTTLSATTVRATDTLRATIVGTNISGRTIEVPAMGCIANIEVLNARQEPVALGDGRVCDASAT